MSEPFQEDTIMEARINNIMLHQKAPCIRCKVLTCDIARCRQDPNLEPYMTIMKLRRHQKYGIMFGIYTFFNTIKSQARFQELLPAFPFKGINFAANKVEITTGDTLKVRVFKKVY